jgi:ABC-2 type transport system permease protein
MTGLSNIYWLGTKELRILSKDLMMILFIVWSFGFSIYMQSKGGGETINNAAIAIVDEDNSTLSRAIRDLFYPPYFKTAVVIPARDIDHAMDQSLYSLILVIPPRFEEDVRKGRNTEVQLNIDATAVQQAALGAGYVQSMVTQQVSRYVQRSEGTIGQSTTLVVRRAFNPNGTQAWFRAIVGLVDQVSMLTIVLTGGCSATRARTRHDRASPGHAAHLV